MSQFNSGELPKGMTIPEAESEASEIKQPVPLHLGRGNYVAAIYQALGILPVEIIVDECIITERHGQEPEVRLVLRIIGDKEVCNGDND